MARIITALPLFTETATTGEKRSTLKERLVFMARMAASQVNVIRDSALGFWYDGDDEYRDESHHLVLEGSEAAIRRGARRGANGGRRT